MFISTLNCNEYAAKALGHAAKHCTNELLSSRWDGTTELLINKRLTNPMDQNDSSNVSGHVTVAICTGTFPNLEEELFRRSIIESGSKPVDSGCVETGP